MTQTVTLISLEVETAGHWAGRFTPTFYAFPTLLMHTITWSFGLAGCGAVLTIAQAHVPPARHALRWLHRTRDYLLLGAMTLPLHGLALLVVPHLVQTRIIFQASGFFFSDTKRGRAWCACHSLSCSVLLLAWAAYAVAWFMGYVPAPPFFWFDC